jgi:hypothetical protein
MASDEKTIAVLRIENLTVIHLKVKQKINGIVNNQISLTEKL